MFVVLLPSTTDNQTVFWPLDKKVFVTGPSERLEQKTNRNIFHHWHKWLSQRESSSLSLSGFVHESPEFNPSITSWNSQLVGILNSLLSIPNICLFIQCPHLTLTSLASDRQTDSNLPPDNWLTDIPTTDWLTSNYKWIGRPTNQKNSYWPARPANRLTDRLNKHLAANWPQSGGTHHWELACDYPIFLSQRFYRPIYF